MRHILIKNILYQYWAAFERQQYIKQDLLWTWPRSCSPVYSFKATSTVPAGSFGPQYETKLLPLQHLIHNRGKFYGETNDINNKMATTNYIHQIEAPGTEAILTNHLLRMSVQEMLADILTVQVDASRRRFPLPSLSTWRRQHGSWNLRESTQCIDRGQLKCPELAREQDVARCSKHPLCSHGWCVQLCMLTVSLLQYATIVSMSISDRAMTHFLLTFQLNISF